MYSFLKSYIFKVDVNLTTSLCQGHLGMWVTLQATWSQPLHVQSHLFPWPNLMMLPMAVQSVAVFFNGRKLWRCLWWNFQPSTKEGWMRKCLCYIPQRLRQYSVRDAVLVDLRFGSHHQESHAKTLNFEMQRQSDIFSPTAVISLKT